MGKWGGVGSDVSDANPPPLKIQIKPSPLLCSIDFAPLFLTRFFRLCHCAGRSTSFFLLLLRRCTIQYMSTKIWHIISSWGAPFLPPSPRLRQRRANGDIFDPWTWEDQKLIHIVLIGSTFLCPTCGMLQKCKKGKRKMGFVLLTYQD